jgi:hemerythrin
VDYAIAHFADEEELMQQIDFEGLIQHRWRHHSFVGRVADMALEWGQGRETSLNDILLFLREWLLDHVLVEDMKIRAALQARQKSRV